MASSTSALSSPLQWTKFESSSLISPNSRSRLNLRKRSAVGISCDYSRLEVRDVSYRPPGTQVNILNGVSFSLPQKSDQNVLEVFMKLDDKMLMHHVSSPTDFFNCTKLAVDSASLGLIFGRSGSGKTTLLQLLAGLSKPTSGSINIQRYSNDGKPNNSPEPLPPEKVGIVFQFPERYFVADNVLDEVIFGWPRRTGGIQLKEYLAQNLQRAINWVGLNGISLDKDPYSLSGGYKRRLALAIQLVQIPELLILDEPLAGLDWKARADVVRLLKHLKKELTILVVSHDIKEMAPLVDHSWRMDMGGFLIEQCLPV